MVFSPRSLLHRPLALIGAILGLVVLIGLGLFGNMVWQQMNVIRARGGVGISLAGGAGSASPVKIDPARVESDRQNPSLGNPNAKVHIVEFVDYQCPFSKQTEGALRTFAARHPDDVYIAIRDFPIDSLHPLATEISRAARCVFAQKNDHAYWSYRDQLFAAQESLTSDSIRILAGQAGANLSAFDTCMLSHATDAEVQSSVSDGFSFGIPGTPTFFVNGTMVAGALKEEQLEQLLTQGKL